MPLCNDYKPRSSKNGSCEPGASVQTNLSKKQRENDRTRSHIFPPRGLPCKSEEAGSGCPFALCNKRVSFRDWANCSKASTDLGKQQHQHFARDEEGKIYISVSFVGIIYFDFSCMTLESFGILKFVPFLGLACQFAFDVAMISAFGNNRDFEMEGIKHLYQCLEKGYNSMPLDLPGTPFHKAMKVIYKKIMYILFLWSTQFSKFNQYHWTLDIFNFFTTALEFKTCHKLTLIWSSSTYIGLDQSIHASS